MHGGTYSDDRTFPKCHSGTSRRIIYPPSAVIRCTALLHYAS
uniref:Uncharacterized protein n=1 Tax=Siphoviridae sp. ctZZK17 TaxID=2826384 RepID=A0A8S5MNY3_9CAUD|nr:MAG TPA: hypothetical protein [Siphoviridae sp. ctZZK17]